MVKLLIYNFCLLVLMLKSSQSANILVIEGTPSPSHHIWIRTLMIELTLRGHNITSISSDIDKKPTPNLHYIHLENTYNYLYKDNEEVNFVEAGQMGSISSIFFYTQFCVEACKGVLSSKGVQTLLQYPDNFKFDLVLHDNLLAPCLVGFLHKFNYPPMIHVTAFHSPALTAHWVGSQFYPFVKPYFSTHFGDTFFGRIQNFGLFFLEYFVKHLYMYPKMNGLSKVVFPNAPKITELEKRVKLVLINSHPVNEIVEPLLPNVIPVGGLQVQTPVDLSDDLKRIADSAQHGLVLFSLGTNVRSDMLGKERLTFIVEAFRNFPKYTFLWKFESDKLPIDVPANVHIRPWMPQTEILNHKNTVLFVTHSGLLSTQEAVWYGIPMLCLPVFADQHSNSALVKRANVAEVIPVANVNSTNLKETMTKMFTNLSVYRANSAKLSNSFRDQPELPLKRAAWWIEWVLRNPDAEFMNSPARELNVFSRHAIDVILFYAAILAVTIYLLITMLCKILKCFTGSNQTNQKIKKH